VANLDAGMARDFLSSQRENFLSVEENLSTTGLTPKCSFCLWSARHRLGGGLGTRTETAFGGITRGRKLVRLLPHLQHQIGQPEVQVRLPQP
jgi:hypothetical protein